MPPITSSLGLDAKAVVAERTNALIQAIEHIAPTHVLWLPSSTLKDVINHVEQRARGNAWVSAPLTREEEGIGIAGGLVLGGAKPLLIVQDNGIGNALTALNTFALPYHLPLLLIVSQRGGMNEYNSMIHTLTERVHDILDAAHLRTFTLDERVPIERWSTSVVAAWEHAYMTHRPVILLCNLMY
ncbi:MAG TPA: thiamine pyrophosphate-binding protein [Chloroflexota bacterium]|nr:thiamine pyrophosphate-binding protein [Chloroflexota bacterium]